MPSPTFSPPPHRRRVRGFSLVEVMLGILLGMFSVIAVLKVFSQSDTSQRIGNATSEAQVNATMALDLLSRDIRQAGQSLNSLNLLGCTLNVTTSEDGSNPSFVVAPLVINSALVPEGDAHTDTLLVMSGDYAGSPEGDAVSAGGSGSVTVTTASAFAAGDYLTLGPSSPTATTGSECSLTLEKAASLNGNAVTLTDVGRASSSDTSVAYNLGSGLSIHAYAVRNGSLTLCDYLKHDCSTNTSDTRVWVPMASQVVSLRAEYGQATSGTDLDARVLSGYDQATPSGSSSGTADALYCRWAHVMSARIAVVGRGASKQREVDGVTATLANPTWDGSANGTAIDLSGLTDWKDYRYRVMQATIPLRNMLWLGASAC